MKNGIHSLGYIFKLIWLIFVFFLCLTSAHSADLSHLRFSQPSSLHLPGNKVQCAYQDKKGFLWIGSTMGLYRFDGYETQSYKNDLFNNVTCIREDNSNRLWIGTRGALKVLHEETGELETYTLGTDKSPNVSALAVTKENDVIIGTDDGIYRYSSKERKFIHTVIPDGKGGELRTSIKTILVDRDGNVWFGTWAHGLWRWDLKKNKMIRYPQINQRNSVHYLFQDSKGSFWAISWNEGLYRLHISKDLNRLTFDSFKNKVGDVTSLGDNMAYCISEDENTGLILVGSRCGLSITDSDHTGNFTNYYPDSEISPLPYGEIDAIVCDKENGIWLGSLGGGVFYNNSRRLFCSNLTIGKESNGFSALSAVSLCYGDKDNLWIGMENHPLYLYNIRTGKAQSYNQLPEFKGLTVTMVNNIARNPVTGQMYFAFNGGVIVYRRGEPVQLLTQQNSQCIQEYHTSALNVDDRGNLFIGFWNGFSIKFADGHVSRIMKLKMNDGKIVSNFEVRGIQRDDHNNIWLLTSSGLLKVEGNLRKPETLVATVYDISDQAMKMPNPLCLYKDRQGNLWVGSDLGLSRYNSSTNKFENVTDVYHLTGCVVFSIQEDQKGEFWLGTNNGLVHLMKKQGNVASRVYTKEDGLSDNYFNIGAATRLGSLLFFGNSHGVVCINTENNISSYNTIANVTLTGLNVNGKSVALLPSEKRSEVISDSPEFCDEITIPSRYDDFTLFFSSLSYRNINQVRYAYKIEGLDSRWQHTDSYSHNAHYNQLPAGTYNFLVKAMNDDGTWSKVKTIKLNILPPFYATWWAYTIYGLILLAAGYRLFIYYRGKQTLQHTLNMHTMVVYHDNQQPLQMNRDEPTVKVEPKTVTEAVHEPEKEEDVESQRMEIPEPNMDDVKIKSANEEFLDKAVSIVKEHLKDENYNVDRFVSDMSMSKSAVYKRMKTLTGMNTSSFIKNIRLKAALQIMKQNCEVRVSDLAYLVGFSDPKYFSACFKKEYGMTPSEYVDRFLKK